MSDGSLSDPAANLETKSPAKNDVAETAKPRLGCTFVWWLLGGLLVGSLATLIILRWQFADPLPEIAPAEFHSARDRWKQQEIPNYNIEVKVTGTQGATYRVQVRDRTAVAAWRNDQPLQQQRIFSTWSVPGMFGTIGRDIDAIERHAAGRADQFTPRLTLRGEFDAKTGMPRRYRRIEWGSTVAVAWEVVKFEALP